jgi:hypothetical protein
MDAFKDEPDRLYGELLRLCRQVVQAMYEIDSGWSTHTFDPDVADCRPLAAIAADAVDRAECYSALVEACSVEEAPNAPSTIADKTEQGHIPQHRHPVAHHGLYPPALSIHQFDRACLSWPSKTSSSSYPQLFMVLSTTPASPTRKSTPSCVFPRCYSSLQALRCARRSWRCTNDSCRGSRGPTQVNGHCVDTCARVFSNMARGMSCFGLAVSDFLRLSTGDAGLGDTAIAINRRAFSGGWSARFSGQRRGRQGAVSEEAALGMQALRLRAWRRRENANRIWS